MTNAAAKPTRGRARAQRLEARVTVEQKTLIERAAALQGHTVTDFVVTSVQDAAREGQSKSIVSSNSRFATAKLLSMRCSIPSPSTAA